MKSVDRISSDNVTDEQYVWTQDLTKGQIVSYGQYCQASSMHQEAIDWIVLDETDDEVLLLSKYILDAKPYHTQLVDITWENCYLRRWLNSDFIDTAFTETEKSYIVDTSVVTESNRCPLRVSLPQWLQQFNTRPPIVSGGNPTVDKVFILSWEESIRYFPKHPQSDKKIALAKAAVAMFNPSNMDNVARVLDGLNAGATEYAKSHNLDCILNTYTTWFRSPGNTSQMAVVTMQGDILYRPGCEVNDATNGVRPAIWVKKKAFMRKQEEISTDSISDYDEYDDDLQDKLQTKETPTTEIATIKKEVKEQNSSVPKRGSRSDKKRRSGRDVSGALGKIGKALAWFYTFSCVPIAIMIFCGTVLSTENSNMWWGLSLIGFVFFILGAQAILIPKFYSKVNIKLVSLPYISLLIGIINAICVYT